MAFQKRDQPSWEHEVNQDDFSQAVPPTSVYQVSTYGLNSAWTKRLASAIDAGVLTEFLILLEVIIGRGFPHVFGTVLAELTNRTSFECLRDWEEGQQESVEILLRLARATLSYPRGFGKYNRLTQERSARDQFEDGLFPRDYLLALIIQPTKYVPAEDRDWIQVLRIWTLVHSLARGLMDPPNIQDKNLREVATALRLACNQDFDRIAVIARLQTSVSGLSDLNSHLAHRSSHLLTQRKQLGFSRTQITFLRALRAVAVHEQSPDDTYLRPSTTKTSLAELASSFRPGPRNTGPQAPLVPAGWGDDEASPALIVSTDDDGGDIVQIEVDPSDSYHHQRLKAGSVLLLTGEEYQHLPWSWRRPNPFELHELSRQIKSLLQSSSPPQKLLGAFTWIADAIGRSLGRLLDIEVGSCLSHEWRLDPKMMLLQRMPPMRTGGWVPVGDDASNWVVPVAEFSSIVLPKEVASTLRPYVTDIEEGTPLGQLWRWPETPQILWRSSIPPSLSRVTPGMLGSTATQRLFTETGDSAFALLLASHPSSGLPGACAYASWGLDVVDAALGRMDTPVRSDADIVPIGAGSRMDPLDRYLIGALDEGFNEVARLRECGNPIAFHNAFAGYLYLLLLAGCGARPIRDLFESPDHLNLDEGFGYINDKAIDKVHQGRLALIPFELCVYLASSYAKHLERLAAWMEPADGALASRIRALAKGSRDAGIPYIFLLDPEAPGGWSSISEAAIELLSLFNCPLPLRLFRHRMAIRLRREGLDPEIIDSLLGHVDAGAASHGDDSVRIWQDDMASARPVFERVYASLEIRLPEIAEAFTPPMRGVHPFGQRKPDEHKPLFGEAARQAERAERARQAQESAEADIENFLAGRPLEVLDEGEFHALSRILMFNDVGMPRPTGAMRYEVLMDRLEKLWRVQGKRPRVKKRFARLRLPASPFRPEACRAGAIHAAIRNDLKILLAERAEQRLAASVSVALATVRLCVERRIASPRILRDVCLRENFRLVTMERVPHFEHGLRLDRDNADAAVMRLRIDGETAALLDRWLASGRTLKVLDQPVETVLIGVQTRLIAGGWLSPDANAHGDLLAVLCRIMDQVNVMTLPGILAGHLGGRVESYALGWRDWSRLELGRPLRFSSDNDDDVESGSAAANKELDKMYGGAPISPKSLNDKGTAQHAAHEFYDAIRNVLEKAAQDSAANTSPTCRRRLATALDEVINQWNGRVSTAVLLLGQWLPSYVFRSGKKSDFIAISTMQRYCNALSPSFVDVASEANLLDMDEEEVTALYVDLLSCRRVDDSKFVEERLGEFHYWASAQGVADPDWSEMPPVMRGRRASPGFVSEREYRDALKLLLTDRTSSNLQRKGRAFLLLCCYRFGLREGEALGMLREDFQQFHDELVLLVRDNRVRKLKTNASRRQVPGLFRLSRTELKIVSDWFLEIEASAGDKEREPLFGGAARSRNRMAFAAYVRPVIQSLKTVTGNPRMTLHHARHTAANRVAITLFDMKSPVLRRAIRHGDERIERSDLVGFLLGREGVTRRTSWAISRFSGHAGSVTLFKNYIHVLGYWIDELVGPPKGDYLPTLSHAVALDRLPSQAVIETGLLNNAPTNQKRHNLQMVLKFLRLLSRRHDWEAAADSLGMPLGLASGIQSAARRLGERMSMSSSVTRTAKQRDDGYAFLRRIEDGAWNRMIVWAESLEAPKNTQSERNTNIWDGGAFPCTLQDVEMIVSPRRQLVMWQERHFRGVQRLLGMTGINNERYAAWLPSFCNEGDKVSRLATQHGFSLKRHSRENPRPQLDAARSDDNDNLVQKRCCLLLNETRVGLIRNRYQLIAMLIGLSALSESADGSAQG